MGDCMNHEKDSGLAESCKNDDSSENDLMSPRSSKYNTNSSGGCCDIDGEMDVTKCREAGMQTDLDYSLPNPVFPRRDSIESIESELLAVSLQMKRIEVRCLAVQESTTPANARPTKPPRAPRTSSLCPVQENPGASSSDLISQKNRKSAEKPYLPCRNGLVKMSSPEFFEFPAAPKQKPENHDRTHMRERELEAKIKSPPVTLQNRLQVPMSTFTGIQRAPVPPASAPRNSSGRPNLPLRTVLEDEELSVAKQHIYEQIKPGEDTDSLQRSSGGRSVKRPVSTVGKLKPVFVVT